MHRLPVHIHGHFNPRSHERSDGHWASKSSGLSDFNPRSHERSDERNQRSRRQKSNFNPRSHERSDFPGDIVISDKLLFQSTLPREERPPKQEDGWLEVIFQSTLPREERQFMPTFSASQNDFNPRSHERSDYEMLLYAYPALISIHAPTRGATTSSRFTLSIMRYFNPRSHERSDLYLQS